MRLGKHSYFAVFFLIFVLLLSACSKPETKMGAEKADADIKEKEVLQETETIEDVTTLSVTENGLINEGASFDVKGIMIEDKRFNETNNPPRQQETGIVSVFEKSEQTNVIFASTRGYKNEEPPVSTISYYLTHSKDGKWSNPTKLFEQKIEFRDEFTQLNTDTEIFSKKPEGFQYPVISSVKGRGLYFDENRLYIIYPDNLYEMKNFAMQMVEFNEDGSINKNNLLYTGPAIGATEDITKDIIPSSKGDLYMCGEVSKNEGAVYREIGDVFGEPQQIKDNYGLLDSGRVLYIDFETDLAYVSDNGIKMLNLKTGEPIFENGIDKSYSIDLPVIEKVFSDEESGHLYLITRNGFFEKKLTALDKNLNEVSKIELPESKYVSNNKGFFTFYFEEEFERKPALGKFIVPKLTKNTQTAKETSSAATSFDPNNPESYAGVWKYNFKENDENSGGYIVKLEPIDGSSDLFNVLVEEFTPGATFINGSESTIGLSTGIGRYEFMHDANDNSGMVEIEIAEEGIIYRKKMYTSNPGRFNEDLEVMLTVKQ